MFQKIGDFILKSAVITQDILSSRRQGKPHQHIGLYLIIITHIFLFPSQLKIDLHHILQHTFLRDILH